MTGHITEQQARDWVDGYLTAWRSGDPKDIEAIFTEDAASYEWPYDTAWTSRDEIVEGWQTRAPWQEGGWDFDWELVTVNGDTFAVKGVGVYAKLGRFANLWVVTLAGDGRCAVFRMWNNEI